MTSSRGGKNRPQGAWCFTPFHNLIPRRELPQCSPHERLRRTAWPEPGRPPTSRRSDHEPSRYTFRVARLDPFHRAGAFRRAAAGLSRHRYRRHGALKSCADTGTHESILDGEVLSTATFKTHYVAPDKLRFEYGDLLTDWFHTTYVFSKLGDSVQTASSVGAMPEIDNDISLAIASLYGVTSGTSGNIPELLLGVERTTLVHLVGLKLLDEATADDGTPCFRLHGKDFISHQLTIWIGKDDLMIRKIESVEDGQHPRNDDLQPED